MTWIPYPAMLADTLRISEFDPVFANTAISAISENPQNLLIFPACCYNFLQTKKGVQMSAQLFLYRYLGFISDVSQNWSHTATSTRLAEPDWASCSRNLAVEELFVIILTPSPHISCISVFFLYASVYLTQRFFWHVGALSVRGRLLHDHEPPLVTPSSVNPLAFSEVPFSDRSVYVITFSYPSSAAIFTALLYRYEQAFGVPSVHSRRISTVFPWCLCSFSI